jgi:hypothetical protein
MLLVVLLGQQFRRSSRILPAIMILEIPLISTATPTSVPIAQRELEGHPARINIPSKRGFRTQGPSNRLSLNILYSPLRVSLLPPNRLFY